MARTIPAGQKRGPRDKLVGVYFSKEEALALDDYCANLGFRSKSALLSFILNDLIEDGFSEGSFNSVSEKVKELILKSPKSKTEWAKLSKTWREKKAAQYEQSQEEPKDKSLRPTKKAAKPVTSVKIYKWCRRCERAFKAGEYREHYDVVLGSTAKVCPYEDCNGSIDMNQWNWESVRETHPEKYPPIPKMDTTYPLYT